uniref:Uncharacterized protein n=1 Tax=Acinetobacter nosocomialis TaxID=106654 RepID=A0A7S9DQE8_ACINO|nr:hypothetical protein WM98B_00140 [Acinetobacter nosocomialis]
MKRLRVPAGRSAGGQIDGSHPAFDLETGGLLGLFARHHLHRLRERPDVPFGIACAIGPVAIELGLGGLYDDGARRLRSRAVLVDVLGQVNVNGLRILAGDRGWARVVGRPFGADHDDAVAEAHLRMLETALGVRDHHGGFESERGFEPFQSRLRISIAEGRH